MCEILHTTSFPGGAKMRDPGNEVEMRIGQTRKTNKLVRNNKPLIQFISNISFQGSMKHKFPQSLYCSIYLARVSLPDARDCILNSV